MLYFPIYEEAYSVKIFFNPVVAVCVPRLHFKVFFVAGIWSRELSICRGAQEPYLYLILQTLQNDACLESIIWLGCRVGVILQKYGARIQSTIDRAPLVGQNFTTTLFPGQPTGLPKWLLLRTKWGPAVGTEKSSKITSPFLLVKCPFISERQAYTSRLYPLLRQIQMH